MNEKKSPTRLRVGWASGGVLLIVAVFVSSMFVQAAEPKSSEPKNAEPKNSEPKSTASESTASRNTASKNEQQAKHEETKSYARSLSAAFRKAAKDVQPSVVSVTQRPVIVEADDSIDSDRGESPTDESVEELMRKFPFLRSDPNLRRHFEDDRGPTRRGRAGMGTGVIIDDSGIVLTNNHVVAGGGDISVRLSDGREYKAVEVKTDPQSDLAIIRIEGAKGLKAARLGDSDTTEIGDWVLALGQPFGLEGTVTAGIISGKGRGLPSSSDPRQSIRADFLQTDAAINPGNSGGPLVDLDGRVVGINTAIFARSGGNDGVGFAVPINLAKWVSGQLIAEGTVHRAHLGVAIQAINHRLALQFGVPPRQGVLVSQVMPESPAAQAGLKQGDVIMKFSNKPITGTRHLQRLVERVPLGSRQPLLVLRGGEKVKMTAVCNEPTDKPARVAVKAAADRNEMKGLGIEVDNLTDEIAGRLGIAGAEGVVVTNVARDSIAARAGLQRGVVIAEIDRKPVNNVKQFRAALQKQSLEEGVLLLVRSAEGARYVVIRSR